MTISSAPTVPGPLPMKGPEGDPLFIARWLAVGQTKLVLAPPNDVAEQLYFSKRALDSENPRSSANGSLHILGADLTSD